MLQIKQLNKAFSNKQIFKNFNYTLETHDHLLISGVSGSGKSTLAQIIAGLDSNYQGTLTTQMDETYPICASISFEYT